MAFTVLRASGSASLIMDAAFFGMTVDIDNPGGLSTPAYAFHLQGGPNGTLLPFGPFGSPVSPFAPGIEDLFEDGTPEYVYAVIADGFNVGLGGFMFRVDFHPLDGANAPVVDAFDLLVSGSGTFLGTHRFEGHGAEVVRLSDFAGAGHSGISTPSDWYDVDADNEIQGSDVDDLLAGFAGNDWITGQFGSDSIFGGGGNDTLYSAADPLVSDVSVDVLYGGDGRDLLVGDDGVDRMDGGKGNDSLIGRGGKDILKGGKGADSFILGAVSQAGDRIRDFVSGEDEIVISVSGLPSDITPGMDLLATGRFVANLSGRATTPGLGQFVYDTDEGKLFWDIDGKGGVKGVLVAALDGAPPLSVTDLILVA